MLPNIKENRVAGHTVKREMISLTFFFFIGNGTFAPSGADLQYFFAQLCIVSHFSFHLKSCILHKEVQWLAH